MATKIPLVLQFSEIINIDNNKIGSKAANLRDLIKKKFTVPDGFVITTDAYAFFINKNNINEVIEDCLKDIDYANVETVEKCANKLQDIIKESSMPPEIVELVEVKYNKLGAENVAVRSSATAEDLPTASFAGQYDTFLNIKNFNDTIQAIKDCYASLWTSRAIFYRHENKIKHSDVKLATIIQKMVPAFCSGVLFTQNPISYNPNEALIESNFGLGESVVSGISSPDKFIVFSEKKKGRRSFKIVDKLISKKEIIVKEKSNVESGTERVNLSKEEGQKCSLSDDQIVKLADLGFKVEKSFGCHQDIEWAIDNNNITYLLQARPITVHLDEEKWFTRGYSDDYWNDPVSPLFFDLLGDQLIQIVNTELNKIMGYSQMDAELLKLHNAHVYFNLEVLKRKVKYEIPKFLRNEDLLNYFPLEGPYNKLKIKNLPFKLFKRVLSEVRVKFFDPEGSVAKTANSYEKFTKTVFNPYCDEFDAKLKKYASTEDLSDLLNLAKELDNVMIHHFRLVRYGIPVHNIGMNLMVQYLLTRFLGKEESMKLFPILISGLEHKLTETNDEIHYLSSLIIDYPDVKSLVLKYDSKKLYEYMKSERSPSIQVFFNEFEKFLKEYGDRGFTRESFYSRWNDAPEYVFDILKTLVVGQEQKIDFKKIKDKNLQYRKKVESYVETKIRAQHLGIVKWIIFIKILAYSRKYIIFREGQRFNLDKWIARNRRIYLEIGNILVKKGMLEKNSDIFFLHKFEIKNLAAEKCDKKKIANLILLIKKRREEFFKYEHSVPPKFLRGSREFDDKIQPKKDLKVFQGIPASQGIKTAPVRIIRTIEQITEAQEGEILIVPRTDPGWTPIFSRIGGLITETGGVLSHGAVVAREYGIPAVTNVPNACQMFKTGQIVSINGYNGTIILNKDL